MNRFERQLTNEQLCKVKYYAIHDNISHSKPFYLYNNFVFVTLCFLYLGTIDNIEKYCSLSLFNKNPDDTSNENYDSNGYQILLNIFTWFFIIDGIRMIRRGIVYIFSQKKYINDRDNACSIYNRLFISFNDMLFFLVSQTDEVCIQYNRFLYFIIFLKLLLIYSFSFVIYVRYFLVLPIVSYDELNDYEKELSNIIYPGNARQLLDNDDIQDIEQNGNGNVDGNRDGNNNQGNGEIGVINENEEINRNIIDISQIREYVVYIETENKYNMCCICCDEFNRGITVSKLTCGHLYHTVCIDEWFNTRVSCPICRVNFEI